MALNLGAIGMDIGQEMGHAFHDRNKRFDDNGQLGDNWWQPESEAEYARRAQCFIEQYSQYCYSSPANVCV